MFKKQDGSCTLEEYPIMSKEIEVDTKEGLGTGSRLRRTLKTEGTDSALAL